MKSSNISVYERKIINLLQQLCEILCRYEEIIQILLQKDGPVHRNNPNTLNETQSTLEKKLQEVVLAALHVIEKLNKAFDEHKFLEDPKPVSERIVWVASHSLISNEVFQIAKHEGKINKQEIKRHDDMRKNLLVMANKVHEYNNNFEEKLFTFEQAVTDYKKKRKIVPYIKNGIIHPEGRILTEDDVDMYLSLDVHY